MTPDGANERAAPAAYAHRRRLLRWVRDFNVDGTGHRPRRRRRALRELEVDAAA